MVVVMQEKTLRIYQRRKKSNQIVASNSEDITLVSFSHISDLGNNLPYLFDFKSNLWSNL